MVVQANWQLVPTTFEGVIEWVYVRSLSRQRDWTRGYNILYQDPGEIPPTTYHYPLVVRIQGYVKSCNLAPLGNWNGLVRSFAVLFPMLIMCLARRRQLFAPNSTYRYPLTDSMTPGFQYSKAYAILDKLRITV